MPTRGQKFRQDIGKVYALEDADTMWLTLLEETCSTLDLIERIEANVADQPLIVSGSTGQQRSNPLLGELRQQRQALSRLIVALGAEDQAETFQQRQTRIARKRRYP
jgi:hypothetical protein